MSEAPPPIPLRKRLLFAAAPIVVLLAICEIVLRLGPIGRWVGGEELWEYRYARSHKDGRTDEEYPVDEHSRTLGWASRAGYRSDGLNTNSQGVRGLREYPFAKPAGEKRAVVVGDSFTFGEGVRDEETYPARLESMLPGVPVINLGIHGYGTDQAHRMLEERGFHYAPDVVIHGFFKQDTERNVLGFRDYAKPVYRFEGDKLVLHNADIPAPADFVPTVPSIFRSRLAGFLGVQWRALTAKKPWAADSEELHVSAAILDLSLAACKRRGAKMLLFYIPESAKPEPETEETVLGAWAQRNGVAFVTARTAFAGKPHDEMFNAHAGGHLTPAANDLCAKLLKPAVEKLLGEVGK